MGWWMVCYVAKPGKEATAMGVVGPFGTRQQALSHKAIWEAVHATHKTLPPWYLSHLGDRAEG